MNRILFRNAEEAQTLSKQDPRLEHVRGVLRMGVGDTFDVGIENGPVGKAKLVSVGDKAAQISVTWGERPPLPPDVTAMVGLSRPQTMRKILLWGATQGIRRFCVFPAARTDPAYESSRLWKEGNYRIYLREGAEQAFDTFIPEVTRVDGIEAAVAGIPGVAARYCLDHYEAAKRLSRVEEIEPPVAFAIGPERGWAPRDRAIMREGGFELVSLNKRILRVESAFSLGLVLIHRTLGFI